MKSRFLTIFLILSLLLSGCGGGSALPEHWEDSWTVISPYLAAEPVEHFTFGESDDSLSISGIYYATWTAGERQDFVNAEGESTVIFDAQIYVITQEFRDEAEARTGMAQWLAREKQTYTCGEESTVTFGGQEFTLLPLLSGSGDNPYGSGCAAFALRGSRAICVELVCGPNYTDDPRAALEAFLAGLHYDE